MYNTKYITYDIYIIYNIYKIYVYLYMYMCSLKIPEIRNITYLK